MTNERDDRIDHPDDEADGPLGDTLDDEYTAPIPHSTHHRPRKGRFHRRTFYCKTCGIEAVSRVVPRGWYSVTRSRGFVDVPPIRLGMYCCLACLDERMDELAEMEEIHADEWEDTVRAPIERAE